MTDHSPGWDDGDDDYRLAAGTPQDAVPRDARPHEAPSQEAAAQQGAAPRDAARQEAAAQQGAADPRQGLPGGTDGPPPQLSGQPGWAYSPTEAATPQVPRQAEPPAAGEPAQQFAGPDGGYGYPQQRPFAAAPTQGYPYPGAPRYSAPAYGDPQSVAQSVEPPYAGPQHADPQYAGPQATGQPYPVPPMAAPPQGQQPYGPSPALGAAGPWPQQQMPPLPPLPTGSQQPGHPYPGPVPPQAAGPRAGQGLSRGAIGGIIAGGVALAVVAVTAVVLTSGGGGGGTGGGAGGGANVRTLSSGWTVPGGISDHQIGTWVTGQFLVRATAAGVKAYRLTDGTPAWSAQPLSGPGVPCAMSPTVSSAGVGTIGFGPDYQDCTTLVGVDTRTGKTLWSTPTVTKDHSDAAPTATFVDGATGVIVNDSVVGGVDLTDGHVVWGYKARGQYCNAYPYGGAGAVLVDDYCADVSPSYVVTALDAATGKELWHRQGTDHVQFGAVLDGSPVVATLNGSGSAAANSYDSSGNARPLPVKGGALEPALGAVGDSDTGARAVGTSTLLLPTRDAAASRTSVTAVNPTTGATLWTYNGESHAGAVLVRPQPDAADAAKVYAVSLVADYGTSNGPRIVSLDPATGRATVIAELPAQPSSIVYGGGTVYLLPDGRVVLAAVDGDGTAVRIFR